MKNRYGVDESYFKKELTRLSKSLPNRTPDELHRYLLRLAEVAKPLDNAEAETQSASPTNIDYISALEEELKHISRDSKLGIPDIIMTSWATRLNAAIQKYIFAVRWWQLPLISCIVERAERSNI